MKNRNNSKDPGGKRKSRFFPNLTETFFKLLDKMQARHGRDKGMVLATMEMTEILNRDGCAEDEIPGAEGEFGLCDTNPVPIFGIFASKIYLARLRTADGGRITYSRIGSLYSSVSDHPIDCYRIFNGRQEQIAVIFISPYHRKNSTKAPKGFLLADEHDKKADVDTQTGMG